MDDRSRGRTVGSLVVARRIEVRLREADRRRRRLRGPTALGDLHPHDRHRGDDPAHDAARRPAGSPARGGAGDRSRRLGLRPRVERRRHHRRVRATGRIARRRRRPVGPARTEPVARARRRRRAHPGHDLPPGGRQDDRRAACGSPAPGPGRLLHQPRAPAVARAGQQHGRQPRLPHRLYDRGDHGLRRVTRRDEARVQHDRRRRHRRPTSSRSPGRAPAWPSPPGPGPAHPAFRRDRGRPPAVGLHRPQPVGVRPDEPPHPGPRRGHRPRRDREARAGLGRARHRQRAAPPARMAFDIQAQKLPIDLRAGLPGHAHRVPGNGRGLARPPVPGPAADEPRARTARPTPAACREW